MALIRFKIALFWLIVLGLTANGIAGCFKTIVWPLMAGGKEIFPLIIKDDQAQLDRRAPDLGQLVHAINSYPPATKFYFVPCFSDTESKAYWWWYIYLVTRYFAYPREIYCQDQMLYDNNKAIYLKRWIGDAKTFNDLPWLRQRHVQYIVLLRHDAVSILPSDATIDGL